MRSMLLLAAFGCGDDRGAPDAGPTDQPVSLQVTRQSVPLAGVPVVFHRADRSLVATVMTDDEGRAEAHPGFGGFVTAVTPFAAERDVKTFFGVQPGDQLVIDGAPSATTPMTTYSVRVNAVAGAVFYRVGVRCLVGTGENIAPNTNPVQLPVTTTCLAPTETLVTALDGFGFPIESVLGAEATPVENGVVDLTNEVSVAADTVTVTVANAGGGAMLESARARSELQFLADIEPASNGGHPIVFPDFAGARQTVGVTGPSPVYTWGAVAATQVIDVATLQLAAINEPIIEREGASISWAGAAANFAFGQLFVDDGNEAFVWSFAGPIEAEDRRVVLPLLADFSLATATRIDLDLAVARLAGGDELRDELRRDGAWLDANNGVMSRQRALLRAPVAPGSAGFAFVSTNLTF